MSIAQLFLPQFDHEMATTRTILERIPEDKLSWAPAPGLITLGRLAGHIAEMPVWGTMIVNMNSLDFSPGNRSIYEPLEVTSQKQLLDAFDTNVALARDAIGSAPDRALVENWQLLSNGKSLFDKPRIDVLATMMMNHIIHHRGQLTVYYRMNGVSVPGLYGPSLDERMTATA
jgi:uncharacterized damage-inducible protein DinB